MPLLEKTPRKYGSKTVKEFRKPYTNDEQAEFNQNLCETINEYWSRFGYEANARVEDRKVPLPKDDGKLRKYQSKEIVSSIPEFPFIKKQVMGVE